MVKIATAIMHASALANRAPATDEAYPAIIVLAALLYNVMQINEKPGDMTGKRLMRTAALLVIVEYIITEHEKKHEENDAWSGLIPRGTSRKAFLVRCDGCHGHRYICTTAPNLRTYTCTDVLTNIQSLYNAKAVNPSSGSVDLADRDVLARAAVCVGAFAQFVAKSTVNGLLNNIHETLTAELEKVGKTIADASEYDYLHNLLVLACTAKDKKDPKKPKYLSLSAAGDGSVQQTMEIAEFAPLALAGVGPAKDRADKLRQVEAVLHTKSETQTRTDAFAKYAPGLVKLLYANLKADRRALLDDLCTPPADTEDGARLIVYKVEKTKKAKRARAAPATPRASAKRHKRLADAFVKELIDALTAALPGFIASAREKFEQARLEREGRQEGEESEEVEGEGDDDSGADA